MKRFTLLAVVCLAAQFSLRAQEPARTALRPGVYAFHRNVIDSTVLFHGNQYTHQELAVRCDGGQIEVHLLINTGQSYASSATGIHGTYLLAAREGREGYRAQDKQIALKIRPIGADSVEVQVLRGTITNYYSGGIYRTQEARMAPASLRLGWIRELSAEDEKLFIKGK